jgi:hypothetical protein
MNDPAHRARSTPRFQSNGSSAERAVLELVRGDTPSSQTRRSALLMAQRHRRPWCTRFPPGSAAYPWRRYALWHSALNETDPARAAARPCQELLRARRRSWRLGDRAARDIWHATRSFQIINRARRGRVTRGI